MLYLKGNLFNYLIYKIMLEIYVAEINREELFMSDMNVEEIKWFAEHYEEIYERYCEEHPEEITSDFILEEDGNWDYIDEIIEELKNEDN
jgi:CO dehydrogenase/acetyl-CoA synthase alpha subunit